MQVLLQYPNPSTYLCVAWTPDPCLLLHVTDWLLWLICMTHNSANCSCYDVTWQHVRLVLHMTTSCVILRERYNNVNNVMIIAIDSIFNSLWCCITLNNWGVTSRRTKAWGHAELRHDVTPNWGARRHSELKHDVTPNWDMTSNWTVPWRHTKLRNDVHVTPNWCLTSR